MIKKFRVGLSLQPAIIALYANSPFIEGKLTSYLSYRSYIWTKTDNQRCGILPFVFDDGFSFEMYVDYLLKVPMYFVVRGDKYLKITNHNFNDFLLGKIKNIGEVKPMYSDWINHISTVFPEVRLKSYIELRGVDGGPWSRVCALPAFWTGLLYDDEILNNVWEMIRKWNPKDVKNFYSDVRKLGLKAKNPEGEPLNKFLSNLLDLSSKGLRNRKIIINGKDESIFLEPLEKILESGLSPAETWKKLFLGMLI